MKQLTKEQVKILSAYEQHFETAVKSSWSRYPGVVALQEIHRIMQDIAELCPVLNGQLQTHFLNAHLGISLLITQHIHSLRNIKTCPIGIERYESRADQAMVYRLS